MRPIHQIISELQEIADSLPNEEQKEKLLSLAADLSLTVTDADRIRWLASRHG
jgi:hypothetical protein